MSRTNSSVNNKVERIGLTNLTNEGYLVKIIEYTNSDNIIVQFEDNHTVKTIFQNFVKGEIRNYLHKSVYNVGYIGIGKYKRISKAGTLWWSILNRCYSPSRSLENKCYIGCTVHPDWYNFQNFAKWYEENFNPIKHKNFHLDKDILIKGNKIYGPKTCCFVPGEINTLLSNQDRGRDLPTGIFEIKGKYKVCFQVKKKFENFGTYETLEQAKSVFIFEKEKVVRNVANQYYTSITEELYLVLINYKITLI